MGSEMCIRDRRFLKKANLTTSQLSGLYQNVLRPVIDYCSSTYHSMLTKDQSERLESLQKKALKTVYGCNKNYEDILQESGIQPLQERRQKLFENFARKCAKDSRFSDWFSTPVQKEHDTRSNIKYVERKARTERL